MFVGKNCSLCTNRQLGHPVEGARRIEIDCPLRRCKFFTEARMIGRTFGCVVLCGWLMASGSLQAHHSLAGVYEMKKEGEVSGMLTKMTVRESPRGDEYRGQEPGRHDHRVGIHDRLRHHPRGTGDRQELEYPQGRGRDHREVYSRRGTAARWGFSSRSPRRTGSVIQISPGSPND